MFGKVLQVFMVFPTVLLSMALRAQGGTVDQTNAWLMYFGNHRLNDRFGVHTEYQWRRNDGFVHWQQSLARVGLDFHTKGGPIISAGYGWIVSYPYGTQPIAYPFTEHRIWEQLIITSAAGRWHFHHRYRLEQRSLEVKAMDDTGAYVPDGDLFKQRARYRFMVTMPITRRTMADNTLFLAMYNEVFLQFGRHVGTNILDQNRLYGALGWRLKADANLQIGYLNQYIPKAD
ncbi:MAG: DUF2490 domain-containing protein, partial [Flavobacteriales bacterium]|nr:DUF2490 domain-containing protein [Flavobacteriales bacterium]